MKNILFNASTNIVGGGLKNSSFFIRKALENTNFNWHFAVCRPVFDLLKEWELNIPPNNITLFENSPAHNFSARTKLKNLACELKIDMVYTMAGPAYVKFPCRHLQGISNPYITHGDWESFRFRGSLLRTLKYFGYVGIQFLYSLKATDFVFQTNYAKNSFKKRSNLDEHRMHVISNAFDLNLKKYFDERDNFSESNLSSEIIVLCHGAGHLHKGFQYIPGIVRELKEMTDREFKFILTLPFESRLWVQIKSEIEKYNLTDHIINHGPFNYTELKNLLDICKIVFVPSLLETFSSSYLEAMCAQKKLVVADKNFAKEVCGRYAIYITPQKSKSTALTFSHLFENLEVTMNEREIAEKILSNYGTQEERFDKIITLITNLISKQ